MGQLLLLEFILTAQTRIQFIINYNNILYFIICYLLGDNVLFGLLHSGIEFSQLFISLVFTRSSFHSPMSCWYFIFSFRRSSISFLITFLIIIFHLLFGRDFEDYRIIIISFIFILELWIIIMNYEHYAWLFPTI